jgi:CheY-like chemotaxis protein
VRWVRLDVQLASSEERAPRLRVTICDLTELKRVQMQVAQADRMATIGQLAESMGHDINNPLTYVLHSLAMLRKELDASGASTTLREHLETAIEGTERIRGITRGLRAFSRHGGSVTVPQELGPALALSVVRGRVLVIDDEGFVRVATARLLSRDHEIVSAASASEALTLLANDPAFDVILCDIMMPNMNGCELHEQLRALHPGLVARMVFMTGGVFAPAIARYLAAHAHTLLEKPIDAETLFAVIAERVAARRALPD